MRKTLYFRKDGIVLALDQEEIIYAEVCKHKLLIHTTHKDMITLSGMTLTKFLEDAEGMDFIRCSRHTVVNKRYVRNVDVTNGMIGLKNDYGSIEIGITYKKIMREEFC